MSAVASATSRSLRANSLVNAARSLGSTSIPQHYKSLRLDELSASSRTSRFAQQTLARSTWGAKFEAAVGRFVLMFVDDPTAVLRHRSRVVKPGGILAFQE